MMQPLKIGTKSFLHWDTKYTRPFLRMEPNQKPHFQTTFPSRFQKIELIELIEFFPKQATPDLIRTNQHKEQQLWNAAEENDSPRLLVISARLECDKYQSGRSCSGLRASATGGRCGGRGQLIGGGAAQLNAAGVQ